MHDMLPAHQGARPALHNVLHSGMSVPGQRSFGLAKRFTNMAVHRDALRQRMPI
ncbi:hypothetical protein N5I87_23615 [Ralstonia sp. CHL-2022]|uniref:Uncharacterized protein n=1 Tax=Ralstonia mojiangensis TaxID=2953895 RepID=A0AAE3I7C8_9RALS|nr:hypothetical protein [Ralstonia mojiangensis]MCT7319018.1 hypothetical protein [Ralstonia mojiangensis]